MKILIVGSGGLLGFGLHRFLADSGHDVVGTLRGSSPPGIDWCRGLRYRLGVNVEDFASVLTAIDVSNASVIVNAAGVTSLRVRGSDERTMIAVNSAFPRRLGAWAELQGRYVIHFSSDGVFSGRSGGQDESATPDAADLYGMSKFLGEPSGSRSLVLRTSLLGVSLGNGTSLVDWLLRQHGPVRGYRRAVFAGLPVNEMGRILSRLILQRKDLVSGVYHLSADPINKYELLELIRSEWGLDDVTVVPDDSVSVDRSLDSQLFRTTIGYVPPPWPVLIAQMRKFYQGFGPKEGR